MTNLRNDAGLLPDVAAFLDNLTANPRPTMNAELIAMIRQLPPEAMAGGDLPVGELAVVRNFEMPGPGGAIALRLFDSRAEREAGPVVVFCHGGGYIVGNIDTHAGLAAEIARGLDLPVVSVEYRLAPENPWPAAPDDAEAAARWIADNGAVFERQFTGLVLCGDSAGATLSLVSALALRDAPATLPVDLVWAIYPAADKVTDYASGREFSDGYALSSADMAYYHEAYRSDPVHWRTSPLRADLAGLPPVLLATAAFDPLRDTGRAYAAKAILAGVSVTYQEFAGTIHGFASYRAAIPSARVALADMITAARSMLGCEL